MNIGIFNLSDGSLATVYQADEANQQNYGGPWGDPDQTMHAVIPDQMNPRAVSMVNYEVQENADLAQQLKVQDAKQKVKSIVKDAIMFGQTIVEDMAAENVMLGITQDGMTGTVLDNMSSIIAALNSGSLYEVISRCRALPDSKKDAKYVTNDRLLAVVNQIEGKLGLTLSKSL